MPTTTARNKLKVLQCRRLQKFPWLTHAFSTRLGGVTSAYGGNVLNLGYTRDDSHNAVARNRELFLTRIGAVQNGRSWPLVTLRQIHSDVIHWIDKVPEHALAGDGLITNMGGILLAVQTADCLPVVIVDPKNRAIGAFHAGWRGTLKRIVEKGVGEMRRYFGSAAEGLYAAIGPGIHACCYQIGPEVREKFESQFDYSASLFRETRDSDPVREKYPLLFLTARAPGHSELPKSTFLDLVEANRRQLMAAGVRSGNISASPLCTSCRVDLLFSYRAEKGSTGRLLGVVGVRP